MQNSAPNLSVSQGGSHPLYYVTKKGQKGNLYSRIFPQKVNPENTTLLITHSTIFNSQIKSPPSVLSHVLLVPSLLAPSFPWFLFLPAFAHTSSGAQQFSEPEKRNNEYRRVYYEAHTGNAHFILTLINLATELAPRRLTHKHGWLQGFHITAFENRV